MAAAQPGGRFARGAATGALWVERKRRVRPESSDAFATSATSR